MKKHHNIPSKLNITLPNTEDNTTETFANTVVQDDLDQEIDALEREVFPNLDEDVSTDLLAEKERAVTQAKEEYRLGTQSFNDDNNEKAKYHLVEAIKPVLSKPLMKSLHVDLKDVLDQTLDSMYHLGLIYQQDKGSSNNYSKAASIFQYCYGFALKYQNEFKTNIEPKQYLKAAFLAEKLFLQNAGKDANPIDDEYYQQALSISHNFKQELEDIRTLVNARLLSIEDMKIDSITERAKIVEDIYSDSVKFFIDHNSDEQKVGLIQRLIANSMKQLGNPPKDCEYSIVGLGSLALGTMTPWSDLEFAIIINEDKLEYKEYFRNLTKLLWIKVINFGETPLSAVGIVTCQEFRGQFFVKGFDYLQTQREIGIQW